MDQRLQESREARNEAMARVERASDPDWAEIMLTAVYEVCKSKSEFSADDVFELSDSWNVERPREARAFGPVMMRAKKAGYCSKVNKVVESRRKELHASPLQVWESSIHGR